MQAVGDLQESKCCRSQRKCRLLVTCWKVSAVRVNEIHELWMICRGVSIAGVYKIPENG